jgi:hypothetical protein
VLNPEVGFGEVVNGETRRSHSVSGTDEVFLVALLEDVAAVPYHPSDDDADVVHASAGWGLVMARDYYGPFHLSNRMHSSVAFAGHHMESGELGSSWVLPQNADVFVEKQDPCLRLAREASW